MRVTGAAHQGTVGSASGMRAARAPAFALPQEAKATGAPAAAAPAAGLLALQDVAAGDGWRRRRTLRRGTAMLDALAELHTELLGGTASGQTLRRLRAGLAQREPGGEAGLEEDVLRAIEIRCAVEIAKYAGENPCD